MAQDNIFIKKWQLGKLGDLAEVNTGLSVDEIKDAWRRAAHHTDPSGIVGSTLSDRIATANSPAEVFRGLSLAAQQNSSIYTQRAMSMFLEDMETSRRVIASGGSIATTTLGKKFLPSLKMSPVNITTLSQSMQNDIQTIEKIFGASASILTRGRSGLGAELTVQFHGGTAPIMGTYTSGGKEYTRPFQITIPRVDPLNPNLVSAGATQQSRYIAGKYAEITAEGMMARSFNHEEWVMRRAAADLVPELQTARRLTDREVREAVSNFTSRMREPLEVVSNIGPNIHHGADLYETTRSNIMRLYTDKGKPIDEFLYADILRRGGLKTAGGGTIPLFPGSSPSQISKNVAFTQDMSKLFHLVPEAADWARRPAQPLRREFMPSDRAIANLGWRSRMYNWAGAEAVRSPMLHLGYISSRFDQQLAGTGITSEGQFLLARETAAQRQTTALKQFSINVNEVSPSLGGLRPGDVIKEGMVLGRDPEGRLITAPSNMRFAEAGTFIDKGKGEFLRISALQDIEDTSIAKYFGAAKGMGVEVEENYMNKLLGKVGINTIAPVEALITMDELKKNRALHYNQMFTSLWEFSRANMNSGKHQSQIASNFVNDPIKIIAELRRNALQGEHFQHEKMLGGIFRIARSAKLGPEQMGQVFGAVPEVFGWDPNNFRDQWRRTIMAGQGHSPEFIDRALSQKVSSGFWTHRAGLTSSETVAIGRGVATGTGQLFMAGLGGSGSGGVGTIEPRVYEALGGPGLGGLGSEIKTEFAERIMADRGYRLLEEQQIARALTSIEEMKPISGALSAAEVAKNGLPLEGGYMKIGKGAVYIPPSSTVSALASYKTPTGKEITPDVTNAYLGLAEAEARGGNVGSAIKNLEREVMNARTSTITGKGGMLRGALPGSAYLTGLTSIGTEYATRDPSAIGITERYANRMFRDLERVYGADEMAEMRSRFSGGEAVSGLIARHPAIGPYSIQPAKFQLISGDRDVAVFNERILKGKAIVRGIEEQLNNPIRLSPLVGLAADTDGDTMAAILVSPKMERSLSSYALDQSMTTQYENYAIRSQVLKAKASGDSSITLREAMAGSAHKLRVTEGGRLGRISIGLQQARAAIYSGMGPKNTQQSINALGLLEWLEQTPISGKHIPAGQEERMLYSLDNIQQALMTRDPMRLTNEVESIMSRASNVGQAALREGFDIDLGEGRRRVPGLDYRQAAQDIINAQHSYSSYAVDNISAERAREISMGRAVATAEEIRNINRTGMGPGPFAEFFSGGTAGKPSIMRQIVQHSQGMSNRLGAAGKSMLPFAKKVGLGLGAALGIAAILSDPPKSLGPGASTPPSGFLGNAGTAGSRLDLNMQRIPSTEHQSGSPTAANLVSVPNKARISSKENYSHQVQIRGLSSGGTRYDELRKQISGATGGNSVVRSNIRDSRSSLTPQKISDIINGG